MKRKIILVLMLAAGFARPVLAEDPVEFADPNLKAAVEQALWVWDPTPSDMLGLTSLYATSKGIRSLGGLEYAKNLQTLYVRWNELSSLSPLSGLTNLTYLDAHGNHNITSVAPLAGLTKLETLVLRINSISSVSALANLDQLQKLDLRWNSIGSISSFSGLTSLRTCYLQWNEISDIAALARLTSLKTLDLRANPLNGQACDVHIPQIIENNPGIDINYDACTAHEVTISSTAGGSVSQPGEGKFTFENGEIAYLEATANADHVFVNWSGSYSDTSNPFTVSIRSSGTITANFASLSDDPGDTEEPDPEEPDDPISAGELTEIYVDDNAAHDPGRYNAAWSDPDENGTAEHPFDSIQEAIDDAQEGAAIIVYPGTYYEQIDLSGKSLTLTGTHSNVKQYPVINGNGAGPVVSFCSGEDPSCTLSQVVVTGGVGELAGAILCLDSSPTLSNCVVVGNRWTDPNGAAICLTNSVTTLINCTIADNYGLIAGWGLNLIDSDVALVNSVFWNNVPKEIHCSDRSTLDIEYCNVAGGWPGTDTMDEAPLFACQGYWADPSDPNTAVKPSDDNAVWTPGDYHLMSQAGRWDTETQTWVLDEVTSPCIDAGDPFDGVKEEPAPNGHVINMGAYGGTIEASKSY